MSLYQIIANQLNRSGFEYEEEQLRKLDIIEYMVLEFAGALHPLQGTPLKCVFRPGHTSNIMFPDGKKCSSLEFGFKDITFDLNVPSISEKEQNFFEIVSTIEDKFSESCFDNEHCYQNRFGTIYAVILPDEDIENAIKSSSLFLTAGDLSEFGLDSLLLEIRELESSFIWITYNYISRDLNEESNDVSKEALKVPVVAQESTSSMMDNKPMP